jgi:hypothetical protein
VCSSDLEEIPQVKNQGYAQRSENRAGGGTTRKVLRLAKRFEGSG